MPGQWAVCAVRVVGEMGPAVGLDPARSFDDAVALCSQDRALLRSTAIPERRHAMPAGLANESWDVGKKIMRQSDEIVQFPAERSLISSTRIPNFRQYLKFGMYLGAG
jgi:hypothetical protein